MTSFTITENEIHPLIKLMGVAFHSINSNTQPGSITFTVNDMKHMFKLHDELYACLDDMERQAQHQLEIEKHYEEQQ